MLGDLPVNEQLFQTLRSPGQGDLVPGTAASDHRMLSHFHLQALMFSRQTGDFHADQSA